MQTTQEPESAQIPKNPAPEWLIEVIGNERRKLHSTDTSIAQAVWDEVVYIL